MNKRGQFIYAYIFGGLMILAALFMMVYPIHYALVGDNPRISACDNIGFRDYQILNQINYCSDSNGNLYSVKMDCSGGFFQDNKCVAHQINISTYKG